MKNIKKFPVLILIIFFISLSLVLLYGKFVTGPYLTFSDGAKFADVARNIAQGRGYGSSFTFYSQNLVTSRQGNLFSARGVPVAMPYSVAVTFRFFGISDFSVTSVSTLFYLLLIVSVFLLARKLFGSLVAAISAVAVAFNINFLNYATSGASEPLFAFLGVASFYLLLLKKKWANFIFLISLILIYMTKPQGIVFIAVLILAWLLVNFKTKKALVMFGSIIIGILIIDRLILYPLSFKYPVYPIVTRGVQALFQYSPADAVSNALRGGTQSVIGLSEILKKTFYNLYNFYKLFPDIASPYMWELFMIGIFMWGRKREENVYRFSTVLVVVGTFILTALTIPFYRYLHPAVPFVYIFSSATLVLIIRKFFSKRKVVALISMFLVLFFTTGQTLGVIFLDSRFVASTRNVGKPPVYVQLSYILRDNTDNNQAVVTNLDTWGSWYGERKTVWFPLEPKQLVDSAASKIPFDAIYLTSYLMDDENYYMGADWRLIFNNPNEPLKWTCGGCGEIAKQFTLKGIYKVSASDDYESQDATAILLIKK